MFQDELAIKYKMIGCELSWPEPSCRRGMGNADASMEGKGPVQAVGNGGRILDRV